MTTVVPHRLKNNTCAFITNNKKNGEAGPLGGQGAVEDTFLNHRGNLNLDSRSSRVSHLQWITLWQSKSNIFETSLPVWRPAHSSSIWNNPSTGTAHTGKARALWAHSGTLACKGILWQPLLGQQRQQPSMMPFVVFGIHVQHQASQLQAGREFSNLKNWSWESVRNFPLP